VLLNYFFVQPFLYPGQPLSVVMYADFLVLVLVTVLIAAGGYVINDYFDLKIDSVNRPGKQVVNRQISNFSAIRLHMVINILAILLGFYLAWRVRSFTFGLIFPFISGLLWIYSARYKRVLFWGNFIVAALSAFVILIVLLFEFFRLRLNPEQFTDAITDLGLVASIFLAYAAFAFLVSMVREMIKDMEDTEGDAAVGCKTLPLVIGIGRTRYIVASVLLLTMLLLWYAQSILYGKGLCLLFWYFTATVQAGAVTLLVMLFRASSRKDYHFLSNLCKLVMLAGILSMALIFFIK
jgi:4-hydroxybenzoate polyprenyltransferase